MQALDPGARGAYGATGARAAPRPVAEVAHALPHRARLRAQALVGRREACERVARALFDKAACDRVEARPNTGSIVLEKAGGGLDAHALAGELARLVFAERDESGRSIVEAPPPAQHHGPTRIAHALAHAMAEINGDVRDALGGHADLGTLLPVAFGLAGVADVASRRSLPQPQWFQLFWWSLRTFMTFNVTAVREEWREGDEPRAEEDEDEADGLD
jgi:hypothetical protein